MRIALGKTLDIDAHVGKIREQVERGLHDGESRQLAVRIVSGQFDRAVDQRTGTEELVVRGFGKQYLAPPGPVCKTRDEECEVEKVWDFVVMNVRYVYDPTTIDTFATLKETLDAGGGDCDDLSIAFATILGSIGFQVMARVISTKDEPDEWVHIYAMVGLPKDNPTAWVPLDASVEGFLPGSEYSEIAKVRDYPLV